MEGSAKVLCCDPNFAGREVSSWFRPRSSPRLIPAIIVIIGLLHHTVCVARD